MNRIVDTLVQTSIERPEGEWELDPLSIKMAKGSHKGLEHSLDHLVAPYQKSQYARKASTTRPLLLPFPSTRNLIDVTYFDLLDILEAVRYFNFT